ncbi:MAG TPA: twin-arginine translocase subunit TatC [Rickettsiales bacterium]|nr:twin-arginine translocase subunit TatC [Rickettsiales bacterium]
MDKQTLQEHLSELKNRIFFCVIFLTVAFCSTYFFATEIYQFLLKPLTNSFENLEHRRMIYTSPAEGFTTFTKLSFYSALFISVPFFLAQFYLFLSPALYKKEKKTILWIFFLSPFLFFLGAIFAYYFLLPLTFKFFLSFEFQVFPVQNGIPIQLETKISDYLNLIIKIIFSFGFAFQLPICLHFLIKYDFITINDLQIRRKYWIVAIFIIAAILTPPDVVSQVILAIPMIFLFEIVIFIGKKIKTKS